MGDGQILGRGLELFDAARLTSGSPGVALSAETSVTVSRTLGGRSVEIICPPRSTG